MELEDNGKGIAARRDLTEDIQTILPDGASRNSSEEEAALACLL